MHQEITDITQKIYELVSFVVGDEEYASEISYIKEIIRLPPITSIPNSPDFIEGVINLRGRIIPVIDLRYKIGMERNVPDSNSRIIVIEVNSKIVGFIVDSVKEVIRISDDILEEPPHMTTNERTKYLTAVAKLENRIVVLIDLKKILSEAEDNQLDSSLSRS